MPLPITPDEFLLQQVGQDSSLLWQQRVISYSFEDAWDAAYETLVGGLGFGVTFDSALGEDLKSLARQCFQQWSFACGLTLIEVPSGQGDIRISDVNSVDPGLFGVTAQPGGSSTVSGDVFLNVGSFFVTDATGAAVLDLQRAFHTIIHEIGHALGLNHSFAEPGILGLPEELDNTDFTVMSYTFGTQPLTRLGMLDVMAVQKLYGDANAETDALYLEGTAGDDVIAPDPTTSFLIKGFMGDDSLTGSAFNDLLQGDEGNDTLDGGEGDDDLIGGDGADTLYGRGGIDWLSGGTGGDVLDGGRGSDKLQGNDGDDVLLGGGDEGLMESDALYGGAGHDHLDGGEGFDLLVGGDGDDVLIGGAFGAQNVNVSFPDFDWLYVLGPTAVAGQGVSVFDQLEGGDGADTALGGFGIDVVYGGSGNDILHGGFGEFDRPELGVGYEWFFNDALFGEAGDDWLSGGLGADRLSGGSGDDIIEGGKALPASMGNQFGALIAGVLTPSAWMKGDVAIYSGTRSDYDVSFGDAGEIVITDLRDGTPDGMDRLNDIEFLEFADGTRIASLLLPSASNLAPVAADDLAEASVSFESFYGLTRFGEFGLEVTPPESVTVIFSDTNDFDPDGDFLFARIVDGPLHGNAFLNSNGNFEYHSEAGFTGVDSFTYVVSDGSATSGLATATVNIAPRGPDRSIASFSVDEDKSLLLPSIGATIGLSFDNANVLTITGYGDSEFVLFDDISGTFTYSPAPNFNGLNLLMVSFTGPEGLGFEGFMSVGVRAVNDAPLIKQIIPDASVDEDSPVNIVVAGGSFNDENDDLSEFSSHTLVYSAELADGSPLPDWLVFTPVLEYHEIEEEPYFVVDAFHQTLTGMAPENFNGTLAVKVIATDLNGASTAQIFNLTVNPVNDSAIISGTATGTVVEDGVAVAGGVLDVADPDAGENGLQAIPSIAGQFGHFGVSSNGEWTYLLDNTNATVNNLDNGETLTDIVSVLSIDGTAEQVLRVTINGHTDATIVNGTAGNDTGAAKSLTGTIGQDIINAFAGNDTAYGMGGNDQIFGGLGNDTLYGDAANEFVTVAGSYLIGNDLLDGGSGNDQLFGGRGDDILSGGDGNDRLAGGSGDDMLTGGFGKDTFVFTRISASGGQLSVALGHDLVTDFQTDQDKIDLSGLGLVWDNSDPDEMDGFAIWQTDDNVVVSVTGLGLLTLQMTDLSLIDRGDFIGLA